VAFGTVTTMQPAGPIARLLSTLDQDDHDVAVGKIRAFEVVLALVMAAEYWARAVPKWDALAPLYTASLWLVPALAAGALTLRGRRAAFAGLALVQAAVLWAEFPAAGNHAYLELFFCALAAVCDPRDPRDRTLFLRAVRWMACVVLFASGLQKLVHGYWDRGQYLAFSLGESESFRPVLRPLLPAAEYERLVTLRGEVGDGPYLVASRLFIGLSNAVYLGEMALAALLLWPRTRALAAVAALTMLLLIEIAAREAFFGLVFANALLLFLPRDLNRRFVPVFAGILLALLLSRAGVIREAVFH
jgi:hypothetical protein